MDTNLKLLIVDALEAGLCSHSENVFKHIKEVFEQVLYVNFLGDGLRKFTDETEINFRLHGHKTVVSPVVFKEVLDPTDNFLAKGLSTIELTEHRNPLAQISVVSDLVDRTEIDNNRHELVHDDGENSYTEHEDNCSKQFFGCRFGTEITEANCRQGCDGIIEHLS